MSAARSLILALTLTLAGSRASRLASQVVPLPARGQGMVLILRDDCGEPGRASHVVRGEAWEFTAADVAAPRADRTVAFDAEAVAMRYTGLDPGARYQLRVTFATEARTPRTQRLKVNGVVVSDALVLPRGRSATWEYPLPAGAAASGTVEVRFEHVAGPNAVVSQVELWSSVRQTFVDLAASADDATHALAGQVTDGTGVPVMGAQVRTAFGTATTDVHGRFHQALPASLWQQEVLDLPVTASIAGRSVAARVRHTPFQLAPSYVPPASAITSVAQPAISLDGLWEFCAAPGPAYWKPSTDRRTWKPARVPGEWALAGFTVAPQAEAAYARAFRVPPDWAGMRVRLHFGAVYCDARVWVNGQQVATHRGGFTPFEADITACLQPGSNLLVLGVKDDTTTDLLSKGSRYAYHRIGGILRGVRLMALPPTHLADLHVATRFDAAYRDATLAVALTIAPTTSHAALVRLRLQDPRGRRVPLPSPTVLCQPGRETAYTARLRAPAQWTAETPALYTVVADIEGPAGTRERVTRRFGFREVAVRGNRLLVNGRPVHLRGVDRHEVHPDMGRAVTGLWRVDAALFKQANVNFVRTSHYPAAPEFLDACDELGLYVIEEAALVWVGAGESADPALRGYFVSAAAEMVERDRDHPSVILWSLANESAWGANFEAERQHVANLDASRPIVFCGAASPSALLPVASSHYPAPTSRATDPRPVLYTEYCHVNCYNKRELEMDPGVRDAYGRYLLAYQDAFDAQPGVIGGAIWAGIDEVFRLPSGTVGYGEWGIIDGYRRRKPEWWHVRNAYSPVRVLTQVVQPTPGSHTQIDVRNRYDFLDLRALRVRWQSAGRKGTATVSAPPGGRGLLDLPITPRAGETIDLAFLDGSREVHSERVSVGPRTPPANPAPEGGCIVLREGAAIRFSGAGWACTLDATTGLLTGFVAGGRTAALTGPFLHVMPSSADMVWPAAPLWHATSVALPTGGRGPAHAVVTGSGDGFEGRLTYAAGGNGVLRIEYDFLIRPADQIQPKEWGLRFTLPADFARLSWDRKALWTCYPDDHIGRPTGEASAAPAGPGTASWSSLGGPAGSNDFRSTKYAVYRVTLARPDGLALSVRSTGVLNARACRERDTVSLHLLAYANGGGEPFLASSIAPERATLKPGDHLRGSVVVVLREDTGRP